MKKTLPVIGLFFLLAAVSGLLFWSNGPRELISPLASERIRPLTKYNFDKLRERHYSGSEIALEKVIKKEEKYTSWLFSYISDGQRVTGMANLPKKKGKRPVIVMLRGHVDDEIYFTGAGTYKAAGVFAENGFITLAPDFLGFGGSDTSSKDILEARFKRPTTVLNLLASIKNLEAADPAKVGIWAHSNGGQIALSVLEINQKPLPTTLWAPVTHGFPQSLLDYMTEMDDQGKKVKKRLDKFVSRYDEKKYSIDSYFTDIQAQIQIHQGSYDYLIKTEWTDEFVETMKEFNKEIFYYQYPRNDHNLKQSWDRVVNRDIRFFQQTFGQN